MTWRLGHIVWREETLHGRARLPDQPLKTNAARVFVVLDRLVNELMVDRAGGQPIIREEGFPSAGLLHAAVLWDDWDGIPDEQRTRTIFEAYRWVEGPKYADRITLVVGPTIPETCNAGLPPHRVVPLFCDGGIP